MNQVCVLEEMRLQCIMLGATPRRLTNLSCLKDPTGAKGTEYMQTIKVSSDDTVGIAVQQSDLPMVQFFLNGEPLHELAINRFRGMVHPALFLPSDSEGLTVTMVFDENDFTQLTPGARFGPVIVARGII